MLNKPPIVENFKLGLQYLTINRTLIDKQRPSL